MVLDFVSTIDQQVVFESMKAWADIYIYISIHIPLIYIILAAITIILFGSSFFLSLLFKIYFYCL